MRSKIEAELLQMEIEEVKEKILIAYNSTCAPDENIIQLTSQLHYLLNRLKFVQNGPKKPAA